ncbi:MAG TPA: phenylpyruvate tautomerase MIF-related protein [Bacteroidales bacterium]|nr:phenylpyruvate tautomerase MIF-related protein [Bacteroidales bacterium]HPR58446.1 phenylpyruvate tautomerase MIF-related protein [Bacteroidales bacterium]HRW97276.1 phenylpyruvate tautomerase MIF-related protein [Bacteroidales bacterium]
MPLFKILTNTNLSDKKAFVKRASAEIAAILGKSEQYVMVILLPKQELFFSGSYEPAMYVELKSIGLPADKTKTITAAIMEFLQKETGIPPSRIYIEFTDVQRQWWGWNSDTM